MTDNQEKLAKVPLSHRHVMAISPGLLFADTNEMKWARKSWEDAEAVAKKLRDTREGYVAFRRFIYDPEKGQLFLDKGWVYFDGKLLKGKDVVDGKTEYKCSDIAKSNIINNKMKYVVWFPATGKLYPFEKHDRFIGEDKS